MSFIKIRSAIALAALSALSLAANATTFNGANYSFSFMGTNAVDVAITTNQVGSFSDGASIAQFFNNASFEATLHSESGVLTSLNNSNSTWSVSFSEFGNPSAALQATSSGLTLMLNASQEFTSARLLLRSNDGLSVLQYAQDNNISDNAYVNFSFNAMFMANAKQTLGQSFTFGAVAAPVPEPTPQILLGIGLAVLAIQASRRKAARS